MSARPCVLGVLATVALSGCGGSAGGAPLSHDEYQAKIRSIVLGAVPAGRLFSAVVYQGGADNPTTVAECGRKAEQLHDELQWIVDEVDALNPPTDAADLQRWFLANARVAVASVGRTAAAAARVTCSVTELTRAPAGRASRLAGWRFWTV